MSTGFRPDLSWLSELRLALDATLQAPVALAPRIDPNVHSRGTVYPHGVKELAHPEPDVFLAGMKSYGRAPTFLAMTGYEQVRSIAAAIAGDRAAALAKVATVTLATGKPIRFARQRPLGRDIHFWSIALGFDHLPVGHLLTNPPHTPVNDNGRYRRAIRSGKPDRRPRSPTFPSAASKTAADPPRNGSAPQR